MSDPDFVEYAGTCPTCKKPCGGYRVIPPHGLLVIVCASCQTITLVTQSADICVASVDWFAKVCGKIAEMAHKTDLNELPPLEPA